MREVRRAAEHRHRQAGVVQALASLAPVTRLPEIDESAVKFEPIDAEGCAEINPLGQGHLAGDTEIVKISFRKRG